MNRNSYSDVSKIMAVCKSHHLHNVPEKQVTVVRLFNDGYD